MTSSASLMTSSTVAMASSLMSLSVDPVLVEFWSGFPCPPPWNEALLFRVNWTSCVSQTVGDTLKTYLADRCHIPLPPGWAGKGEGVHGYDNLPETSVACDTSCRVLVSVFSSLFLLGVVLGVILLWRRRRWRGKEMRGGQQQSSRSGSRGGSRNQYAGIHYASASVVSPERQRPLPERPEAENPMLPRQLNSYVYNPRDNEDPNNDLDKTISEFRPYPPHPQAYHLHLCPVNRRAAYSSIDPRSCSDGSEYLYHEYDYISDLDSFRYPPGDGEHVYTYCTCQHDGMGNAPPANNGYNLLQQYNYYGHGHGYLPECDDHTRQHEISKPFPRYPEQSPGIRYPDELAGCGQFSPERVMGGDVHGGIEMPLITFNSDTPVQDSRNFSTTSSGIHPRQPLDSAPEPGYLPGARSHPDYLTNSRTLPRYLPDSQSHSGASSNISKAYQDIPLTVTRNQIPSISHNHDTLRRYPPGSTEGRPHHPGGLESNPGLHRDSWEQDSDSPYRTLRTSSVAQAVGNIYEDYPQGTLKDVPQRGEGLTLQPQFYMDLLNGGDTSTV